MEKHLLLQDFCKELSATQGSLCIYVLSTSRHSLFKLPYQENYANMCLSSARIADDHILHFICRSEKEFFGYHTFIEIKDRLYCMSGAFNRNLPTTHHAYENIIYRTVEYALEKGLSEIH